MKNVRIECAAGPWMDISVGPEDEDAFYLANYRSGAVRVLDYENLLYGMKQPLSCMIKWAEVRV